jgi:hypothetical protein
MATIGRDQLDNDDPTLGQWLNRSVPELRLEVQNVPDRGKVVHGRIRFHIIVDGLTTDKLVDDLIAEYTAVRYLADDAIRMLQSRMKR